jgi:hypothetical protein
MPIGERRSPATGSTTTFATLQLPARTFAGTVCHARGRGFDSRRSRKSSCKSASCVVSLEAEWSPTTQNFRADTRNAQKRLETRRRVPDFQANSGCVKADPEPSVRPHKMDGGQGYGSGSRGAEARFGIRPAAPLTASPSRVSRRCSRRDEHLSRPRGQHLDRRLHRCARRGSGVAARAQARCRARRPHIRRQYD